MRSKKAFINIMSSLALQGVRFLCGLILPRYILTSFGSATNGLVSSISQFLQYISLVDAGISGVIKAALYKPLAQKNNEKLSAIMKAASKFFRFIAFIFLIYISALSLIYPQLVNNYFDWKFTVLLILILAISTLAQYYFGITNQLLIQSDQRLYIIAFSQIVVLILNLGISILLIKLGANIHIVKLGSAVVFLLRPLFFDLYVKKYYSLDNKCSPDNDALSQRWDGLGQHIAFFIHKNTDIVILTIFSGVKEVSVYSVYLMVISGISNILNSFTSGLAATFGNLIANKETDNLKSKFKLYEVGYHAVTTVLYTTAGLTILSFVSIYTAGIEDVNYIRPYFAMTILAAEFTFSSRSPYNMVIQAAGHIKQMTGSGVVEALINLAISLALVKHFGLFGVAFGTLCAMVYRTIYFLFYLKTNILNNSIMEYFRIMLINGCAFILAVLVVWRLNLMNVDSYLSWFVSAAIVTVIVAANVMVFNLLFNKAEVRIIFKMLMNTIAVHSFKR